MTSRMMTLFALFAVTATTGCADDSLTDTQVASLQSCYDTGFGMKCVSTPGTLQTTARDVNADGTLDEFVCGDTVSQSDSDSLSGDSDSESIDDGTESTEDGDADSDSNSDSHSESDDDCAASESDSDSDSLSDLDGDGDGDGVSDSDDCDCVGIPN